MLKNGSSSIINLDVFIEIFMFLIVEFRYIPFENGATKNIKNICPNICSFFEGD